MVWVQVVFPRVVEAGDLRTTEGVLMQTFEAGVPLMDWAASPDVSAQSKKVIRNHRENGESSA